MSDHDPHPDAWGQELEASTVASIAGTVRPAVAPLPTLTLLAHPNVQRIGDQAFLRALAAGRAVALSRREPTFAPPDGHAAARPLADPHLSRQPLTLCPASDGAVRVQRGSSPVACQLDGVALGDEALLSAEALARGVVLLLADRIALLLHLAQPALARGTRHFGLLGESDAMIHVRQDIHRAAGLDLPVLVRGETGTGKELAARALHDAGPRRAGPYVALNMAAIPPSLAAAELFGAARGAFTGAAQQQHGHFRRADGGTLFLDEIGETPNEVQPLLLRALESQEIQPLGGGAPQQVDVRVIAATDADLENAITDSGFRAPLLHRLSGWEIQLPPLRDRRDDIARLLLHFLRQELAACGAAARLDDPGPHGKPWLPATLVAALVAYDWPGNVRQLRNATRQLVAASSDREEAVADERLAAQLAAASTASPDASSGAAPSTAPAQRQRRTYRQPSEVAEAELLATLRAHRWRLQPTAAALGISRTSLYTLIDRCDAIRQAGQLDRAEIEDCLQRTGGDLDAAAARLEVSRHGLLLRLKELGLRP